MPWPSRGERVIGKETIPAKTTIRLENNFLILGNSFVLNFFAAGSCTIELAARIKIGRGPSLNVTAYGMDISCNYTIANNRESVAGRTDRTRSSGLL